MLSDLPLSSDMKEQVVSLASMRLSQNLAQNKRNIKALTWMAIFGGILLAGISFFLDQNLVKYIQVAGFLLLGYMYLHVLEALASELTTTERMYFTLAVTAGVLLLLGVVCFFRNEYRLLSAVAASAAFVLPYTIQQVWLTFSSLQTGERKTWQFTQELPMQKSTTFLNSIPVRFKVQVVHPKGQEHLLSFRAPVRMKLALIFYHMVQEQNNAGGEVISFIDAAQKPFRWEFVTSGISGARYLDPEESLLENGIQQNAVVVVRQLVDSF